MWSVCNDVVVLRVCDFDDFVFSRGYGVDFGDVIVGLYILGVFGCGCYVVDCGDFCVGVDFSG